VNKAQLQAFHEGRSLEAYQFMGAHKKQSTIRRGMSLVSMRHTHNR
jgi:hypothetical protein